MQKEADALRPPYRLIPTYDTKLRAGNAAATPVSDGERIYASYGTGMISAHSLEGKRLWMQFGGMAEAEFGHASSLILAGGYLIVHFHDIVALNPLTGDEVWRVEQQARHSTCLPLEWEGTPALLTPAGPVLRAADGHVLADFRRQGFDLWDSSPVIHDGLIYTHRRRDLKAFSIVANKRVWKSIAPSSQFQMASPVVHQGIVYCINVDGILQANDARTGKQLYRQRLPFDDQVYPSLSIAGAHLFASSKDGRTLVIQPGPSYKALATNELEPFTSTPLFIGDRIYIRGESHLYCIKESKPK